MNDDREAAREALKRALHKSLYALDDEQNYELVVSNEGSNEDLEKIVTGVIAAIFPHAAAALLREAGHIVLIEGEDFIRQNPKRDGTGAQKAKS